MAKIVSNHKDLPIRELSELTGVNSVTIRAWERRYGLLKPKRTEKGHRLYTQEDVEKIHEIQRWLDKGIAISKIKPLLAAQEKQQSTGLDGISDDWEKNIEAVSVAIETLNANKLEALLHELTGNYPARVVWKYLVQPVNAKYSAHSDAYGMQSKQILWHQIIEEKTLQYIHSQGKEAGREVLIFGLSGERPNCEVLFLARSITEAGFKANLRFFSIPEQERLFVAEQAGADHILLFGDKSLTQQNIKKLEALSANQSASIVATGACSTINQAELKKAGIQTTADQQKLLAYFKEASSHES